MSRLNNAEVNSTSETSAGFDVFVEPASPPKADFAGCLREGLFWVATSTDRRNTLAKSLHCTTMVQCDMRAKLYREMVPGPISFWPRHLSLQAFQTFRPRHLILWHLSCDAIQFSRPCRRWTLSGILLYDVLNGLSFADCLELVFTGRRFRKPVNRSQWQGIEEIRIGETVSPRIMHQHIITRLQQR